MDNDDVGDIVLDVPHIVKNGSSGSKKRVVGDADPYENRQQYRVRRGRPLGRPAF